MVRRMDGRVVWCSGRWMVGRGGGWLDGFAGGWSVGWSGGWEVFNPMGYFLQEKFLVRKIMEAFLFQRMIPSIPMLNPLDYFTKGNLSCDLD